MSRGWPQTEPYNRLIIRERGQDRLRPVSNIVLSVLIITFLSAYCESSAHVGI